LFGQPASCGVGVGGASVVTQTLTVPFFIWLEGIDVDPDGCTGVLFWPGAILPPGLLQKVVADVVSIAINRSPLPRPAKLKQPVRVVPLSVKVGLRLKCTLAA